LVSHVCRYNIDLRDELARTSALFVLIEILLLLLLLLLYLITFMKGKGKGKAIPLQSRAGLECARKMKLPDFKTISS